MSDCNAHKYQNGNLLVLNNKELLNDFSSQKMLNDIVKWTPNSSNSLNRTIIIFSGSTPTAVYSLNFIMSVCTCYPVITTNFVEQMNVLLGYLEMTIQSLGVPVNIANVIKFKLYFYTPQNVQFDFGKTNGTFTSKSIFGENLPVSGYEWIYKFYFSPEFKLMKKKPVTQQIGMFGTTVTQPSIFGTGAVTQPTNMFGTGAVTQPTNMFGTGAVTQPTNMFGTGAVTQPTNMFGTGAVTQPTNAFGTQQPTNAFGTQQPTNAFGTQQPTNAFGTQQPTNAFGTQQQYGFFGAGTGNQQQTNVFGVKSSTQPFNFNNPANKTTQPNYFGKK